MNYAGLFIDSKLPEPFSQEELYNYFEKMQKGDSTAREKIINHNIRLVINEVIKKFNNTPYDKNELVSVGLIGLVKSVDTFDTGKNLHFTTYSSKCIDNEILMFMRKGKKYINDDSLDRTIRKDNEKYEFELGDTIRDENSDFMSSYENKECYKIIRQVVDELPERESIIIKMHFGFNSDKPMFQSEIAKSLEVSPSYISRIIKKVLKKISVVLQNKGIIEAHSNISKDNRGNDMSRKLKSIYEYFKDYNKETVNLMISKLTDEERILINLRYGQDLEKPIQNENWTKENTNQFYGNLVPKMKKLLIDLDSKNKEESISVQQRQEASINTNSFMNTSAMQDEDHNPTSKLSNKNLQKEEYIKIIKLLKTSTFSEMLKFLSPKEAIIVCLKMGYVDEKYFSSDSIAAFLNIEVDEVVKTTKKALSIYKENMNSLIDQAINYITEPSLK